MDSELVSVLSDVQTLAKQRGWSRVADLAGDMLKKGGLPTILIAAAKSVNTDSFQNWIAGIAIDNEVTACSLERLAKDPLPALKADRVVAVFECGRLLEAEEV